MTGGGGVSSIGATAAASCGSGAGGASAAAGSAVGLVFVAFGVLALLRQLAPVLARLGNVPLVRECFNLEGVLRFGLGDVSGAEEVWGRLLELAMRDGDEAMVARANNNFGVVYTIRWERELALASYGRSTAACQRLGYLHFERR